jgi:hypothetical protein
VAVARSDSYAEYREQLLPWAECAPCVANYCRTLSSTALVGLHIRRGLMARYLAALAAALIAVVLLAVGMLAAP